jgi:hypothetical protein
MATERDVALPERPDDTWLRETGNPEVADYIAALQAKLAEANATIDNLAHQATHVTCRMERDRLAQEVRNMSVLVRRFITASGPCATLKQQATDFVSRYDRGVLRNEKGGSA